MISVIIATKDSERALVSTLGALVPGAAAGAVREVIVADAGWIRKPDRQSTIHAEARRSAYDGLD